MAMKKRDFKKAIPVAMAALMGMGGLMGASAIFTDKASISANTNAGTLNMKVTDLSDLNGQYGTISDAGAIVDGLGQNGLQTASFAKGTSEYTGAAGAKATVTANDKDNPSTGIINPGDNGIYAYKIENTAEKSFDTAKVTTVTVTLKDATKTIADADKDAYTIKGLGTSYAKIEGNKLTLIYANADTAVLSGSVEKEKDASGTAYPTSASYAYNTEFKRSLTNMFQDADIRIDTTVYAKQHRNAVDSTISVGTDGTISGTGDWAAIAQFESVADA